jgi:fructuronate reductase
MQRLSHQTHSVKHNLPIKIVHFGIGAFARCHLLDYMDRLGAQGWGVLGVSLRSPDQKTILEPQDYLYSVLEQSENGEKIKVISALKGVLVAQENPQALLKALISPEIAIVSLTITEKGYVGDYAIGFLVEALRLRFEAGLKPFTVLCCDNLSQNGSKVKALVLALALKKNPNLVQWIEEQGKFPATMVDRIVPAQTPVVKQKAAELLGHKDEAALATESFTQWVIEDDFVDNNRPPFEKVGVQMVQDVAPFEQMKLKMLNGAHSAIAYLGQVHALETVDEVMKTHKSFIWQLWDEIIPCVEGFTQDELMDYAESLEIRFLNPHLRHKTEQIAMDGSLKLPLRLLGTIAQRRAKSLPTPALNKAITYWMQYVTNFDISDPLSATLKAVKNPRELLYIKAIFPLALRQDEAWIKEVLASFKAHNL